MMKRPFGIAVAQLGPIQPSDSRASAVARLVEMMREAASLGARMVVFPELALTTFFPRYWMSDEDAIERYFEKSMPSAQTQILFDTSKNLGIGFYLGYAELTTDGHRFNTSILVDQTGKIVGRYRKIHLPGHADHKVGKPFQHLEKKYFEVGNEGFHVWQTMDARIGMCLCNDRRWTETWRVLALQGADIVAVGYNTPSVNIHWPEPPHLRMHSHLISLQAAAYQNTTWIAAAGKAGLEDGCHLFAGSVIVSPAGEILAQTQSEDDEVIYCKADLALADTFRQHIFNYGAHRRPEHYRLITERTGVGDPLGKEPDPS
ncbi:N-carbamoyl-D-amino-acid hydrolase [Orrella marina]|uniref:N-carbamoyl-D-amino-acid hydrolase n=1 Tax=Orrella marina TaxID=2163011 RepID=A0A2R4XJ95_9BURK|nr:N-carbamoyl-D-amino-acid hydrolase [Orrella marina]AWB33892.1 N-carbamoyl-D-amino-acid hydrolase [Orrella marina]